MHGTVYPTFRSSIIHLESMTKRKKLVGQHVSRGFQVFAAHDPSNTPAEFCKKFTNKVDAAIFFSHMQIWKNMVQANVDWQVIIEDDTVVANYQVLQKVLRDLAKKLSDPSVVFLNFRASRWVFHKALENTLLSCHEYFDQELLDGCAERYSKRQLPPPGADCYALNVHAAQNLLEKAYNSEKLYHVDWWLFAQGLQHLNVNLGPIRSLNEVTVVKPKPAVLISTFPIAYSKPGESSRALSVG